MGNSLGGRRKVVKIMKIDGETMKLKAPVRVIDVIKDYPDHVLMDSETVRHLGVRAKALEEDVELKPRRLYFLVQLPKLPDQRVPRRVRSGVINMSARDRLESLLLSRRSVSDLSLMKSSNSSPESEAGSGEGSVMRVRMRVPKAQVAKLLEESRDGAEAAEKIVELCLKREEEEEQEEIISKSGNLIQPWKPALGSIQESCKGKEKRGVRFMPIQDGGLV